MIIFIKLSISCSSQITDQQSLSVNRNADSIFKLLCSMKDYARISVMKGGLHNGTPVVGGRIASDTYVSVSSNSYLIFEFPEAPILNDITFHLWDYDDRIYTYSIDVFTNGQWKNVAENIQGRGIQYVHFIDIENVKAIRMKGSNTANNALHLLNDWLSFRYKF